MAVVLLSLFRLVCVCEKYIYGVLYAPEITKDFLGIPTKGTTLKPYIRIGERKKTMGNSKESMKITVK